MCGIFGIVLTPNTKVNKELTEKITSKLFVLSEARGKESAGIAIKNNETNVISVFKKSEAASEVIVSDLYQNFYKEATKDLFDEKSRVLKNSLAIIAHARLVTNGTQENNNNNQPVIKNGAVAVHNGIITNVDELWLTHSNIKREYEVDTEVMLGIMRYDLINNKNLIKSVQNTYSKIKGTASLGVLHDNLNKLVVSTNNGSIYYAISPKDGIFIFASESFILKTLISDLNLSQFGLNEVLWQGAGNGFIVNIENLEIEKFNLKLIESSNFTESFTGKNELINYAPDSSIDVSAINATNINIDKNKHLRNLFEVNTEAISKLKRCTKCVLPETFPFIEFDLKGVCNYCNVYIPQKHENKIEEFKSIVAKFKSKDGKPDCIVPFSGGRDSSYAMHYIVKELGLHPITYTYDWGMVTDLARRNIARVCGKLGVENIIVSADIHMKRENIRKNVEAWLVRPRLGMIPLFMAGDKQFIYYANQIKEQTGISLNIFGSNMLENTNFKVGFCGISPSFDKDRPDHLNLSSQMKMLWYYFKNFTTNPKYFNSSLIDTAKSFHSYYAAPRLNYFQLYDWVKWDEKTIESTLFDEYEWEMSPDTTTSWRIGDGTAAFYNYIYYTVAGFSEFDTFRSNQIREGMITREEALDFIAVENNPRFESLLWYLEIIKVDFERAIKIINNIPKLYKN